MAAPSAAVSPVLHVVKAPAVGDEVTFYSKGGVRITNTRAVFENRTYAMANVTSVTMTVTPPSRTLAVLLVCIGFLLVAAGVSAGAGLTFLGLIIAAIGAIVYRSLSDTYNVSVSSAAGESTPISSQNRAHVEEIVHALNEAIIKRG